LIAVVAFSVIGSAQQPATPPAPGKGKIAAINTGAFQDGIAEFKAKVDALNRQFEGRVKEVQTKGERVAALENTIKTQGPVLGAAKTAEMTEQLEREKRDYQRKAEDLEADGNKAKSQMLDPLREKLTRFVEAYTKQRGITVLIDLGNAVRSNTVLWFDQRLDVTKDFINEYNKANPVAPAAAAPPAAKP
jgi:outer membrane protein